MVNPVSKKKYLVTGGSGFVGKALVKALCAQGDDVIAISRRVYPELEEIGATSIALDVGDAADSAWEAFQGVDVVFHVAARVDMWGEYEGFYRTNVMGTRHVLSSCEKFNVPYLVYTSSPSVIADETDLKGIDESYPYPERHLAYYPQTKAMAEQEVLSANRRTGLATCALRPHLIWGPGDNNFVPTILERARKGKLVQVGSGANLVDTCFIDDCVRAHLLAAEALANNPEAQGRAYFISQGEPVPLWEWINLVLERNGLPPVKRKIPFRVAWLLASLLEKFSWAHPRHPEPLLTRFLVSEMTTDHYFDLSSARKHLKFSPKYSVADAMERTFPLGAS